MNTKQMDIDELEKNHYEQWERLKIVSRLYNLNIDVIKNLECCGNCAAWNIDCKYADGLPEGNKYCSSWKSDEMTREKRMVE